MVSKNVLFQFLRMIILLSGMEISGYTIFMFSHFVNDLDPNTAQRNFCIGFSLLWMSAFIINPLIGAIIDKTGHTIPAIAIICCIKDVCLLVYTFSKNIYFIATALFCCMGNGLLLVVYTEIKYMFEPEERVAKMSKAVNGMIIGDIIVCLLRLIPRDFMFKIGPAEITNNTLPMLINAILFSILAVIFTFFAYGHKTRHICDDPSSTKGTSKQGKIFVIFLTCFVCRFSSVTMVVAIQEFGEKNQVQNVYLGIIFTLRYMIAFSANKFQQRLLNTYSNKNILTIWQIIRIICFALVFISTFISNTSIQLVILLSATFLSSIPFVNDDAVLLPELWKSTNRISFYCALYGLVDGLGICATFLYPLFNNFIELYISIGMVIIAFNFFMLQRTGLI